MPDLVAGEIGPDASLLIVDDDKPFLHRLARAMEQMPEAQRQSIELHYLHGLTLVETAEAMERTTPSVMGLLRRGLARLRTLLEDHNTNQGQ